MREASCIVSNFYIKSQLKAGLPIHCHSCIVSNFYIKSQRNRKNPSGLDRCIVSNFYIKSQLLPIENWRRRGCIVSNFYIKSQPQVLHLLIIRVLHPYVPRKKRCSANWGSRFDAVFPFCKTNISKKFQLLRYFGTGAFDLAPEIQNFAVLFVRYAQDARHSGRRHRFADPPDMDLHIFLGDAVPDVDRVLHHREAVLFQCLAKLGRVAPFGFGMGRQVEKYE